MGIVNIDKIINNYELSDHIARFFVLDANEESWLHGEIELDWLFKEFVSLIKEEIYYSWGSDYSDMNEYFIYYIDTKDKNTLKLIEDDDTYHSLKNHKELYIAIIHKNIPYRIIENIPPLFEWFMDGSLF